MEIYFVSSNADKRREVAALLSSPRIAVHTVDVKLEEIQSVDMAKIAEDKAVKGFKQVWRPVLVEQTGLLLRGFGDLPGGFTQIFWDTLGSEQFVRFFSALASGEAVAKSVFAFCDGRRIRVFQGTTRGRIAPAPRGENNFGWDSIFIPDGRGCTYAEMTQEEKCDLSMRSLALKEVREYLEGWEHGADHGEAETVDP